MTVALKKKRLDPEVKLVVDEWKRQMGSRPFLVGSVCRQAMVANSVMAIMRVRAETHGHRPMGYYVALYEQACAFLSDYLDIE